MRIFRIIVAILLAGGLVAAAWLPRPERVMGSYATSVQGRTQAQRVNAELAARALDGKVIEPGHVFSFNRTVGGWTPDRGYRMAPVSYDGELVADWGGGVCQTSTTLYNAALLAGLEIVERHRHTWAPKYVPPGRDAAVAQFTIDLRLRNPYPFPVRIRARTENDSLAFEILGEKAGPVAAVRSEATATVDPTEVLQATRYLRPGQRRVATQGRPGVRVSVYRIRPNGARELVSQDSYPPMNRVVLVGASPAG